ncbi:TPA: dUTP diphosphatase [Patescibacteria group bacterium]|nr:MAG: Deoxyuridine 5'-triphosphate nucleotidohydrolase [Parcubacteria group bacterium GW2011_GWD2_42_14]HCC05625.1 dUTP diphosphatase [Patescibacteria group bacterium]
MTLPLKVLRIDSTVKLPTYGHAGDAACDLFAAHEVTIAPGERVQVGTGVAFEIPEGYAMFIWDKSGLSHKHGLKTLGGVIDAGYRGEVQVGVVNLSDVPYTIEKNHKVAQMVLQKIETVELVEVEELSVSSRGAGAFGSTGK